LGVAIFNTNRYLALFEFGGGKGLIENIEEQREYIFFSRRIVDEVMRKRRGSYAKRCSNGG
jgi:hypothetical protein